MEPSHIVRRVVLVVLDGLRPDAIARFGLATLDALVKRGAATLAATTVAPSVTAACMASILSGVPPEVHGLRSDRFHVPRSRGPVFPMMKVLAEAGLPSSAFCCRVPWLMRGVAGRASRVAGATRATFEGWTSADVLSAARRTLITQRDGLIVMHWPDGDHAGHEHGWMSPAYGSAARAMDASLGALVSLLDIHANPDTLLIAMADHGGGGVDPRDHDSAHPLDRTIPIVLAGAAVAPGSLGGLVSLLDVPATVLWAMGVNVPANYAGEPLVSAFARVVAVA